METKEVEIFRTIEGRPALLTVRVPAEIPEGMSARFSRRDIVRIKYLDAKPMRRMPRKQKKEFKIAVGVPSGSKKVKLIRASLLRTTNGHEASLRKTR